MADYNYTAVDRAGKQVSGAVSGKDEREAGIKVRALGYYPVKVTDARQGGGRNVVAISGGQR
ncbi:MAG: hypothetical protein ABJA67_06300, partial [Chthonomonadales bacterium]